MLSVLLIILAIVGAWLLIAALLALGIGRAVSIADRRRPVAKIIP